MWIDLWSPRFSLLHGSSIQVPQPQSQCRDWGAGNGAKNKCQNEVRELVKVLIELRINKKRNSVSQHCPADVDLCNCQKMLDRNVIYSNFSHQYDSLTQLDIGHPLRKSCPTEETVYPNFSIRPSINSETSRSAKVWIWKPAKTVLRTATTAFLRAARHTIDRNVAIWTRGVDMNENNEWIGRMPQFWAMQSSPLRAVLLRQYEYVGNTCFIAHI